MQSEPDRDGERTKRQRCARSEEDDQIGTARFELATFGSQSRRANQAAPRPADRRLASRRARPGTVGIEPQQLTEGPLRRRVVRADADRARDTPSSLHRTDLPLIVALGVGLALVQSPGPGSGNRTTPCNCLTQRLLSPASLPRPVLPLVRNERSKRSPPEGGGDSCFTYPN